MCESVVGSSKVQMRLSSEGYLRPETIGPLTETDVADVRAVCPGIRLEHSRAVENYHPIWGPIQTVRTGFATDAAVRREGSSGGVISALAIYLLESKQVAFVAQIAASASNPLSNELQLSRTRDDVIRAAGSRYGPSAPLARFGELLDHGEPFALIGKPCDVAAVRLLSLRDARVDRQVRFLISFMCAGIPSEKGTRAILAHLGVAADDVTSFRYRGDGWPGKARAVTRNGQSHEMDYATSWGTILNRHLQFRCKICPDGTGEFADVVGADAWYGKDGYPDFEEREGRSLVLGRTALGEQLIREAVQAGAIDVSPLPIDDINLMQPYQRQRKCTVLGRIIGMRLRRGVAPSYRRLGLVRASLAAGPIDWLRNAWGTFKRARGENP